MRKLTNAGIRLKGFIKHGRKGRTKQQKEIPASKPETTGVAAPNYFAANWHQSKAGSSSWNKQEKDQPKYEMAPYQGTEGLGSPGKTLTPANSRHKQESDLAIDSHGLPKRIHFPANDWHRQKSDISKYEMAFQRADSEEQDDNMEERDEREPDDGEREGNLLYMDVYISGQKVRGLVDTGAGATLIHKDYGKNRVPYPEVPFIQGANGQKFPILGKSTIEIHTKNGIKIPITGLVSGLPHKILFGTDFQVAYATKMKIAERTLEIQLDRIRVKMTIKFRYAPREVDKMNSVGGYNALQVVAKLNGGETRIVLDTGASFNLISKAAAGEKNLLSDDTKCKIGGSSSAVVGFKGKKEVDFEIDGMKFKFMAVVPHFDSSDSMITGNEFNKKHIDVVDFGKRIVVMKAGNEKVRVRAILH